MYRFIIFKTLDMMVFIYLSDKADLAEIYTTEHHYTQGQRF